MKRYRNWSGLQLAMVSLGISVLMLVAGYQLGKVIFYLFDLT